MWSLVAQRTLAIRGRAVVPYGARQGPLPITTMSSQAVLEQLWDALLVSSKRHEEEKEEISRKLCEENQMKEELTGQIKSLQTEQAPLQSENSQLKSEIQKLWLKPQVLPESHQEQEETHCLEMEKKCPKAHRNMNCTHQMRNLYKKMAKDTNKELERTTFSYQSEILFHERRAQERWMAALLSERKLNELRKEDDHVRQCMSSTSTSSQVPALLKRSSCSHCWMHSPQRPRIKGPLLLKPSLKFDMDRDFRTIKYSFKPLFTETNKLCKQNRKGTILGCFHNTASKQLRFLGSHPKTDQMKIFSKSATKPTDRRQSEKGQTKKAHLYHLHRSSAKLANDETKSLVMNRTPCFSVCSSRLLHSLIKILTNVQAGEGTRSKRNRKEKNISKDKFSKVSPRRSFSSKSRRLGPLGGRMLVFLPPSCGLLSPEPALPHQGRIEINQGTPDFDFPLPDFPPLPTAPLWKAFARVLSYFVSQRLRGSWRYRGLALGFSSRTKEEKAGEALRAVAGLRKEPSFFLSPWILLAYLSK
ncbi:hypothetical protein HPG69_007550 [Diceros bicornis minor]|uniref:Uncharacterized protein n=1 Tax=Diceros bicornis minor TaxID=77932 RepID=A0A7J7EYP6_DICBM|nr:hypothetical protein HPG69_007550 [Diceros bicornis minor]